MKKLVLVVILSLVALPTLAQEQTLDSKFLAEWSTVNAASMSLEAAHRHFAELAQVMLLDWQRRGKEVEELKRKVAELEARPAKPTEPTAEPK